MDNPIIIGLLSWFLPGVGHLVQKRYKRGIIIAGVIWTMFAISLVSGGQYYPGFDFKDGMLLYLLNVFARFGSGLGAIASYIAASSGDPLAAAKATFEYGGRMLEIAGLLNYLATIDAVDVAYGRKR
jgi:uncharacterized protein DUF6677